MQKINLDLLDTAAQPKPTTQPRGFEQPATDFTTGSSHVFPPSLSNLFSPATPSEGSRSPRDILQYNTLVCALLVLLPVALAFGGLELVYMLDQQAEANLRSIITVQHAAPAATRQVLQPTATMEEVQPLPRSCSGAPHTFSAASGDPSPLSHANPAQEQGLFVLFLPFLTLVLLIELCLFVLFRALEG